MRSRLVVCTGLAAAAVLVAGAPARAQLPPTPQLPRIDLPAPVADAVIQAIDTVLPVVGQTAIQLRPVATAGGFALRMPCAAAGGGTFLFALASSLVVLPIPTGIFLGPALVFCSGAFEPGPGDPLLAQVDGVIGDPLEEAAAPVVDQLGAALAPARPNLDEGCGVVRIFSSVPTQAPPPLHRFNWVALVCG
ncbi:MAG: hypothetical protein ACRDKJ_00395 [Actinomycetota bacterium]